MDQEFYLNLVKQRVSELLLFNSKRAIFQPYHDENKSHFNKMIMSHFVLDQHTLHPFSRYLQTFLIVPNVEMNITWIIFINYLQGVDENYDGILSEFFTPYHALVDLVCRVAVNQQILNEHIINLSEYQKAILVMLWCFYNDWQLISSLLINLTV
jgi:hypothetical protein